MPHSNPLGYCPDKCSGGRSDRQMIVNDRLLIQFPEEVRARITAHGGAKRCTYCGRVYLSPLPEIGGRLGFWEAGVHGTSWVK